MAANEIVYLGAGCFWGVQHILNSQEGVLETVVGYMGGKTENPTYKDVCSGETGHAEVVKVVYDPSKISFLKILDFFWRLHDPTTLNRQGPDIGTQYRSAIFWTTPEQEAAAKESMKHFNDSKVFQKPAVTEIRQEGTFYAGEEYHQHYFERRGGPICHALRER